MIEKIFTNNNRGLKLAAILHKPHPPSLKASAGKEKYPAVMVLHGFTGYKEQEHLAALAADLAKNGFVAIRFDASGFGESEGSLSDDYRFSNYLQDTECVYEFLKKQNFVDSDRIGIAGHSWGGKMCVIFGARHPEIQAIVPIQPPKNLRSSNGIKALITAWQDKGWREKISAKYGKIRIPFGIVIDDDKFDTVKLVKEIKIPIFFILGKQDEVVCPNDTKKIFEAANNPKKLWEVENIGHHYKNYPEQVEMVNKEVIKFFKENLKEKETILGRIKNIFLSVIPAKAGIQKLLHKFRLSPE